MSSSKPLSVNDGQSSESDSTAKPKVELSEAEQLERLKNGGFPEGFTDNVTGNLETPQAMLKRVLRPNESVVGEFDCYFPEGMIPVWKIIVLLIVTCGLYAFVLLVRSIERWCYKNKCCTPPLVQFVRGKLAVTSLGRIICWKEEATQIVPPQDNNCIYNCIVCLLKMCFPEAFRPPTRYNFEIDTKVYSAKNVRQITQNYKSAANCLCYCIEYDCSVQLTFGTFNYESSSLGFMETRPASYFISTVAGFFNLIAGAVERSVGISSSNERVLHIVSGTYDRFHNGDIHAVCEELSGLHSKVINCLPTLPDVFVQGKDNVGPYQIVEQLSDVTIVDDRGAIKIPSHWMPMMKGEIIIATYGEVYKMGCMELFKSIITFGYYYCIEVRPKKIARSAFVLTNKRLVVIDINQVAGTVPTNLNDFVIQSRSLLPRHVWGGFVQSKGPSLNLSLWTDAGEIYCEFPGGAAATPFANAAQLTVCRRDASRHFKLPKDVVMPTFDQTDLNIIPLLTNETPFSKFKGTYLWSPFGKNALILGCINAIRAYLFQAPVSNACSDDSCSICFPWPVHILTCALRPFKLATDVVITPNAFISVIRERNYGLCGFGETARTEYCISLTDYTVTWICSEKFIGYNFNIDGDGDENCCSRIFKDCCIGPLCCPIGESRFNLNVDLDEVKFNFSGKGINKNWLADDNLLNQLKSLDMVQVSHTDSV